MHRIGGDVRNHKAHENGSPMQRFLVIKLATAVLETANRRLAQAAVVAVGKIQTPLLRLRIV
jgi:hypothetical protein